MYRECFLGKPTVVTCQLIREHGGFKFLLFQIYKKLINQLIFIQELENITDEKPKDVYRNDTNIETFKDVAKILELHAWRGDINEKSKIPFGNIDIKLYSNKQSVDSKVFSNIILTKSGPVFTEDSGNKTTVKLTPFIWKASGFDVSHTGQPEIFNFDYLKILWSWS